MTTRTVSMKNYLIRTYTKFFRMFYQEIICCFTIIHRSRISNSLNKSTICKCCYRNTKLICPVFNGCSKSETGCKSTTWNNQYTWTVLFVSTLTLWLCNNHLYRRRIRFIYTARSFILCGACKIIRWKIFGKSVFCMCRKFLAFFKRKIVVKQHFCITN